ncbi:twin-arginine translocation signal domain-containing protein [Ruegeria pomeroyi]|uniref:ABC transporter substrate-binding protein n=1 Tax=Ruegeria alba TaxID=2916756 RepID=A0ABS9P0B1_9RHOB|nr:ABC transporter substrate-binding protein [Ruegeria alba]MCE8522943.1 twin-arginine translocation signal domain-containing protein [Ruegeria pomeroyi]MCE8525484.1 twin-arginine translocation signal domain-containing protein [Ruegeria pomeroyi]MCE8535387.1 twin-arginine translocation signal domain-containing protein [Ruegeria pomeroyi]MCE8548289.1 twin-arginine translocation signal domain-containing protein [Ruegeria pomeroyi]MCG6559927.1 ABC transporter substrate-binding protein [Ruegeria a
MTTPNISWTRIGLPRRSFLKGATALGGLAATGLMLPRPAHAAEGTLKTRTYADIRSMDPAFSQGVVDEEIQAAIYNKLIQYNPGRQWGWQLDAADMIEQVDDTHINFALKDTIGFTNGFGAMTAEDVKFSFERIIDDTLESTNKPDWGPLDHVEVTGERTGTIVLKNAFQPLWSITLPYIAGNIVSKAAFESVGGKIDTQPVATSGPYLHAGWEQKQKTTLRRNPDWQGEPAAFDEIQIYHIDDEKAAEIAFEAGEIDFTRVSLDSVERLKSSPIEGTTLDEYPSLYYVWVGMNLDNPKMANPKLRQAIQYAIDVPTIMAAAYFGAAEPSTGIIAPGLPGHRETSLTGAAANLEKAQALMAESGEGNVSLTISVLNKSANVTAAQIIQANLAAIGITLEISLHEGATFWELGSDANVEMVLNRYSMTPDPYYATSWFISEQAGIWNWERFKNEEFDALHLTAQSEADPVKRAEMYVRAQDLMEESGAYKFLTHEATPVIYRNSIVPALRPDGLPLYRYFGAA